MEEKTKINTEDVFDPNQDTMFCEHCGKFHDSAIMNRYFLRGNVEPWLENPEDYDHFDEDPDSQYFGISDVILCPDCFKKAVKAGFEEVTT